MAIAHQNYLFIACAINGEKFTFCYTSCCCTYMADSVYKSISGFVNLYICRSDRLQSMLEGGNAVLPPSTKSESQIQKETYVIPRRLENNKTTAKNTYFTARGIISRSKFIQCTKITTGSRSLSFRLFFYTSKLKLIVGKALKKKKDETTGILLHLV